MRIAIIQDGPIYNNLKATIEKTTDYISQAKSQGADLVVFGECWLSGYPVWLDVCKDVSLWDHKPIKEVWAQTYRNSISLHSDEMKSLQKAIKQNSIYVILGANESVHQGKGNSSIYNTVLTFGEDGEIINHHRKLVPTYTEKLVHTHGDGHGLKTVKTKWGNIGSLICWEHWMPMARQAMHDQSEDLHIGLWPFVKEMHQVCSRQYAFEGRCHVIAVGQIMEKSELPEGLELSDAVQLDTEYLMRGGSVIYGPDGRTILEPTYDERKLIMAEIDLSTNLSERMNLSVSGHYQRHDVFRYKINKKRPTK